MLLTRLLLFLAVGLGMAVIVGGNLWLAYRLRPRLRPHSPEQATLERYRMVLEPPARPLDRARRRWCVGLFAGLSAQSRWNQWLLFRNGGDFGVKDPEFGVDIGFYVFQLPFWRYLLGVGFTAVVLAVIGALAVHYLFGGVRLQGVGDRMTNAARAHLSSLVAVFVLLKAVAYVLDRRAMLLEYNEGAKLYGAGYADVNALLPAKEILAYISIVVAIAIIVFSNAGDAEPGLAGHLAGPARRLRGGHRRHLPLGGADLRGQAERQGQGSAVHPAQHRRHPGGVRAGRPPKTTPYAANNLTPPASLATDTSVVPNVRLLDPQLVSETYTQLQQVRGFYDFGPKLDIDRYAVNGQDLRLRGRRPGDQLRRADRPAEQLDQPAHRLHPRVRPGGRPGQPGGLRRAAVLRLRLPGRARTQEACSSPDRADPGQAAADLLRRADGGRRLRDRRAGRPGQERRVRPADR